MRDVRYEPVRCEKCGQSIQLIDFHGNPHKWACGGEPDPQEIERLKRSYPEVRFNT